MFKIRKMSVPREGRTARRSRGDEFDDSPSASNGFDSISRSNGKQEPCVVCHDMKELLERSKQLSKPSCIFSSCSGFILTRFMRLPITNILHNNCSRISCSSRLAGCILGDWTGMSTHARPARPPHVGFPAHDGCVLSWTSERTATETHGRAARARWWILPVRVVFRWFPLQVLLRQNFKKHLFPFAI